MATVQCKKCGGPHPQWECQASQDRVSAYLEAVAKAKTEERDAMGARHHPEPQQERLIDKVAADAKRAVGRPTTGFDRKAYQRQKAVERRAKAKETK